MKTTVGEIVNRLARHAHAQSVDTTEDGILVHGTVNVLDENPAEPCPVCHHTAQKQG